MFNFRTLKPKDFPLLFEWLAKDYVKEWWNDDDDTIEKVVIHYGEQTEEVERFILFELKNNVEKSIGYFQYYFISDDSIGIDQFIGEEEYIGRGVGEKTIKMFIELIKQQHKPRNVILDPSPDNKRAIRCYEKIGFRHFETKIDENGCAAYMMKIEF